MHTKKTKILFFLLTAEPFSKGETFIENEIGFLESAFDKIFIYFSANLIPYKKFYPKQGEVLFFNDSLSFFNKILCLRFVFTRTFWKEISFIVKSKQMNLSFKKTRMILVEWQKAILLKKSIHKQIKLVNDDAVDYYIYSYWSDYKALSAALLKKSDQRIMAISRAHRSDLYYEESPYKYNPLKLFIFSNLDKTFFVSEDGLRYAKKNFSSIDKTKFGISRLGTKTMDSPINILNTDNLVIVSCSHTIPVKRIDLIIQSLSKISGFYIHWHHFGNGYDYEKTIALANELLNNKVNITYTFHDFVPNSEVLSFYKNNKIDLFINVSSSEGLPVSIMEAMSFGIPCIATAVGGTPEIIVSEFNGYLLPLETSVEEIVTTISTFSKKTNDEKNQMRSNAYKTWEHDYSAEANYKKFIEEILAL